MPGPAAGRGVFPLGETVALADLEADPHPLLARLREHEPVSWLPALSGWLVTRRDLALRVLRDTAAFGDPGTFDVHRPNARLHLAFAHGPHFCLGAHLARLEAQAAVRAALSLPGLRLDPDRPSAPRGLVFRKPPSL